MALGMPTASTTCSGNSDDEVELDGWTIFLDLNGNGTLDLGTETPKTQVAAGSGTATFTGVTTGSRRFWEVVGLVGQNTDPPTRAS